MAAQAQTKQHGQDTTETHSFGAEVARVLHLVIHSLYTNRDIFLRELISNASDACDKLRYEAQQNAELLKDDSVLKITVSIDAKSKTITVADNGIGMGREDLIANLGTIARSGTQEFMQQLEGGNARDMALIGQFGVGFYSAFMVASSVEVVSRKAGEDQAWLWKSSGDGNFSVSPYEGEAGRGTRITLHLRESEEGYLDYFRLQHIIKTYSDHITFPITLQNDEGKESTVNQGSALWMRPKSEITDEQYQEFYRHVSHLPDKPWMTLHTKAEGAMEYNSLLFIPASRPFDVFHPDRMRRVKLYVKRVFITDQGVDIVPPYLRFLRGVVDSEDLPLNVSRETLQHNALLGKIRNSLVSKVLAELKKRAESAPDDYKLFWENFGPVLKEGLCEAIQDKEKILEVCRFTSTQDPGAPTSLDAYIARMKPEQEAIYYLGGESVDNLMKSPQLEGFLKQGVEVLLFTDHVDDFWVNVVHEYKGKPLKSATRAGIELEKKEEKTDREQAKKAPLEPLLSYLKTLYGEGIADVRVSHRLTESPACLAVEEGMMDIRFERFLIEQKQLKGAAAKIVEINPTHPIIEALAERVAREDTTDEVRDAALLLLDQAKLAEGLEIGDPRAFNQRLGRFMRKAFAV